MPRLTHFQPRRLGFSRVLAGVVIALSMVAVAGCGRTSDHAQPVEAGAAPVSSTAPAADGGPATVVVASIGSQPSADGSWRASGLAHNDGSTPVGGLHVRATLIGSGGQTIGMVDTDSPVAPVRAGESVPFTLAAAGTAATDVRSVSWLAVATAGSTASDGRDLAVSTYWTRPYGDAHRLDLPSYRDPAGAPVPFAVYGSLTNGGGAAIGSPTLVLAWSGTDGRILAVASGRAVGSDGTPVAVLAAGASDDALVIISDATSATGLDGLTAQTWSVGR
jgi:hypothetical protein